MRDSTTTARRAVCGTVLAALVLLGGCARQPASPRAWEPDSIAEAYDHSVAALMWHGSTRAFQVTQAGDFFNGAWLLRIEAAAGSDTARAARAVAFEDRWLPVLRWTRYSGPVRWDFEVVAVPEPAPGIFSPRGPIARQVARYNRDGDEAQARRAMSGYSPTRIDSLLLRVRRPLERNPIDRTNFFVSLRIRATNRGQSSQNASWRIQCEPPPIPAPFADPDSAVRTPWNHCWSAGAASDSVIGCGDGSVDGAKLSNAFVLKPGEQRTFEMMLSAYPTPFGQLKHEARQQHEEYVEQVRSYWLRETERGARFALPDTDVVNAIRASEIQLLQLRERRTTDWVPIGNPFQYRDVWLRDGARAMQALAVMGYTTEARQLAESFLAFQWPHGPFVSQAGQLDGTGQALWAFEQVFLRPSPDPQVKRFARSALLAWRALQRQRSRAGRVLPGPFARMLPATDPHDAELIRAQLVGNDAWSIAGYRAAERLLRAAGMNPLADSIAASREAYAADFKNALRQTQRRDIPPSWQGGGIDWGNLSVGYPCMALPADDPHLDALAHRYWAPLGGAGTGWYRDPDSLHSYVAVDLATWAMLAGQRATADSVLDAALYWRSASGGAAEIFTRSGRDFGTNFPPHATAAAELLALIRNALVFDDSDTLQLTLGARAAWWRGTTVERAPTRWGLINLEFRREGSEAMWRWSPVPVWTELNLPPGYGVNGALPRDFRPGLRAGVVLVPPHISAAKVSLMPFNH